MAFWNKKKEEIIAEKKEEKPTPAFLRSDYPYKAVGTPIIDMSQVQDGILYEIKCNKCEMSIRSQGQNIRGTYERMKDKGCLGCGNKDLVVKMVDMSKAPQISEIEKKEEAKE